MSVFELARTSGKGPWGTFAESRNLPEARRLLRKLKLIRSAGLQQAEGLTCFKHLRGDLWEVWDRGLAFRAFSYACEGKEVLVILSVENTKGGEQRYGRFIEQCERDIEIARMLVERM